MHVIEHTPDHPRIRGEHGGGVLGVSMHLGSSPHTRGARSSGTRYRQDARIIPAYAGSTTTSRLAIKVIEDHPRIRGEHRRHPASRNPHGGSSPHTRGAHPVHDPGRSADRIIPAYAGSTGGFDFDCIGQRDHPRIRGEHYVDTPEEYATRGSSPHTRGAHR